MKAEITHFQRHWLFANMQFTKEDKILIKNLFEFKGLHSRYLVIFREFSRKKIKCKQRLHVVVITMGY